MASLWSFTRNPRPALTSSVCRLPRPSRCLRVQALFGGQQKQKEEEAFTGFRYDPSMQVNVCPVSFVGVSSVRFALCLGRIVYLHNPQYFSLVLLLNSSNYMQRWIRAPNYKPTKEMFTVTPLSGSAYTVWPVMHRFLTQKKLKTINQDEVGIHFCLFAN